MRKPGWVICGMIAGAALFQGLRLVHRHLVSRPAMMMSHSHDGGPDWATMSDANLEIARVFLIERQSGVRAAFDTLSGLAHRDRHVAQLGQVGLHQVAHSLGRYAATRMPDGVSSFRNCVPGFLSGCPHGVIEGYFESHPPTDPSSLRALCDRIAPKTPAQWPRECAHGVGHGLFQSTGGDVRGSIRKCRGFSGSTMQRECLDGVFMSAVQRDMASHGSRRAGCSQYEGDEAIACWYYEPAFLLWRHGNDPLAAGRDCPRAPENVASACARGLGHQVAGMMTTNYAGVAAVCSAMGAHAGSCIQGAVATYTSETWLPDGANRLCAGLMNDLKKTCDIAVAAEMKLKS